MANLKVHKKKNPWLMPLCLLVVIGTLIAVYAVMDAQNKAQSGISDTTTGEEVTMILERDVADVRALSYSFDGESNAFTWSTVSGSWSLDSAPAYPLLQEPISTMAAAVSSIGVYRTLDTGDTGEYGFDYPAAEFSVTFADGTVCSFAIGALNSVSGYRYLLSKDSGTVYTVNAALLPFFQYTLADLFAYDELPTDIEVNHLSSATLKTPTGERKIEDADTLTKLYTQFQLLKPALCADWSGTDTAMEQYGIGAATLTLHYRRGVTVTDTSGNESTTRIAASYGVRFGNVQSDGRIPYVIGSTDRIYLTDAADLDAIEALFDEK